MQLRDYQIECRDKAVEILKKNNMCLLAMECRLGKTFVSLSTAKEIGARKVLFITTKKAIPSIEHDYKMMKDDDPSIFSIRVTNYEDVLAKHKSCSKKAEMYVLEKYPNVAKKGVRFLRAMREEYLKEMEKNAPYLLSSNFDTIIIDECHKTGAFPKPSGVQKVLKQIANEKVVILLSGTPNPESHVMFYHEFAISSYSPWSKYKNFYAWAKDYVNIGSKKINGYDVADYSNGIEEKIMPVVRNYIVTMTQCDAGFTTKREERVATVPMTAQIEKAIKRLKVDRVANITMEDGTDVEVVAETPADLINKIHQLSGGTLKLGDEYHILDSSKADWIEQNFHGKHIAIFYVYKAERDLLLRSFPYVTEDWQTFQNDPKTIFIGQIKSVREGIKLDTAELSIFYSMEYSYVSYAQGINRIVSKERETPSIIYFLTSQCKIEKMILDCVHDKEDFTLKVFYGR